jgi:Zn-dependent peptidase ImmA (M78 family)
MRNSYPYLEKKADDFRQRWGYGTDKPINLQSLLLGLNVPTFFKPMKKISGMAFKPKPDAKFMLINSSQTIGRQNFTICHELYHLFVQKDFEYQICITQNFNSKDPEEYNADVFASYLLLPSKGIRDLIPEDELEKDGISLDTIVKIEQAFQCSRIALLHRLKKMSFISESKMSKFNQLIINSAYIRGYPCQLYKPTLSNDVWGDYGETALELFNLQKISEGDYTSLMIDIGIDVLKQPTDDILDF